MNVEDVRKHIEKNGLSGLQEILKRRLDEWRDVEINIGVTGDSGVGKSSFINAIRGIDDDENDAAETGVIATTTEAAIYSHPINNKIKFWDLPGIGTRNCPDLKTYCEKVCLENYDTFLILTAGRFTDNNLQLARKVKSIKKSFFFVRTKIDEDIDSESRKKTFNEESTLNDIREDCRHNLTDLVADDKDVFLMSNHQTAKWEFDRLRQAILDNLPHYQKESLTLSLTSPSRDLIKRKVKVLQGRIWMVAAASAAIAAVPLPGLSLMADLGLLTKEMNFYKFQLGILEENFKIFPGTPSEVNARSSKICVTNVVQNGQLLSAYAISSTAEEFARFIPLVGSVLAGSISFATTYAFLSEYLKDIEETALSYLDETSSKVVDELHY